MKPSKPIAHRKTTKEDRRRTRATKAARIDALWLRWMIEGGWPEVKQWYR